LTPADIDLVIVATSTPDYTFPATATQVQTALGIHRGVAFDLQAVCSGFVFATATADKFLRSGSHDCALVIGAETFSRLLDWSDRTTCVLFGDGAGAIVLAAEAGAPVDGARGVLTSHLRSDGRHREKLYVDGGPSTTGKVGHLRMLGKDVYRHAVGMVTDVMKDAFDATGVSAETLDWFVPHQANRRIIDASAQKLGIAPQKVEAAGKTFRVALRDERTYLPYSFKLLQATHKRYAGTDTPKDFRSRVLIENPQTKESREVEISMNSPLRYAGRAFFQYKMTKDELDQRPGSSVLQVVRNPSWLAPYIGCIVVALGMLWQFLYHLARFLSKPRPA